MWTFEGVNETAVHLVTVGDVVVLLTNPSLKFVTAEEILSGVVEGASVEMTKATVRELAEMILRVVPE